MKNRNTTHPRRVSNRRRATAPRDVLLALSVYDSEIHRGVARFGCDQGWHIPADLEDAIPRDWRGDGVLTRLGAPQQIWRRLRRFEVPIVDLAESRPNIPLPRVTIDNAAVGRLAAEFFLQRGYRNFAFVHRWELGASRKRRDHFRAVISAAGYHCEVLSWTKERKNTADTASNRRRWIKRRLAKLRMPSAVFVSRDVEAVAVIDSCIDLGLDVPGQVAVLGVGNSEPICECLRIPLSSIEENWEQVGYQGAELLDRLMRGQRPPTDPIYVAPGKVVQRRSTDSLAFEHPLLVAALRYIHENAYRPINMADIVKQMDTSRSGLERIFREHYVRPPMEEVRQLRLAEARRLLAETDKKIVTIAELAGYPSSHHLCRVFKQQLAQTPNEYRARCKQA